MAAILAKAAREVFKAAHVHEIELDALHFRHVL